MKQQSMSIMIEENDPMQLIRKPFLFHKSNDLIYTRVQGNHLHRIYSLSDIFCWDRKQAYMESHCKLH